MKLLQPISLAPLLANLIREQIIAPRLTGSDHTIKILYAHGYTDPNDGRAPIPVPPTSDIPATASSRAEMWMAIATKTVLIE